MSHTDHELMRTLVDRIRSVEEAVGRPIGILADLQGPKLRVGKFANGKETLKPGQTFTLDDNHEPGDATRVYLPHPEILRSVEPGHRLLIDDGKLELKAVTCDGKSIVCTVIAGTAISDRKGVSLPDTDLPVGALTEKDRVGPRRGARNRRRLGGAVVRPAAGRPRRSAQDRARPRAADVEDREAAGGRPDWRRSSSSPTR